MKSFRRKLAASLIEDLLTPPAQQAWISVSRQLQNAEGPEIFERELVPGFEETVGEDILWKAPEQQSEESLEAKKEKQQLKRVLMGLGKLGADTSWEYEAGGRRPYRASSPRAERDNRTGTSIAWDQAAPGFDDTSKSPEPPLLNQGTKSAYEWGTIETPKYKRAPVSESSSYDDSARAVSSLFDQNAGRNPMTDEVPGLNFRGSDMHYASPKYARTMDRALIWQPELWTTSNDEKTEHARLPGKKPVVRDSVVLEDTGSVWDDHEAFQSNKGIVDNTPINPGPPV